jgi:hypothetical protein
MKAKHVAVIVVAVVLVSVLSFRKVSSPESNARAGRLAGDDSQPRGDSRRGTKEGETRTAGRTEMKPPAVRDTGGLSDDPPNSISSFVAAKKAGEKVTAVTPIPGMLPAVGWGNVGRSTPELALQTELWSEEHQEVDVAASMITFEQEARDKLQTLLAGLPDDVRAEYGSPERLAALLMTGAGDDTPLTGFRILSSQAQGTSAVALRTEWQYADGQVRQNDWQFRQDAGGWKRVLPPAFVDKLIRLLMQRAAQPSRK